MSSFINKLEHLTTLSILMESSIKKKNTYTFSNTYKYSQRK